MAPEICLLEDARYREKFSSPSKSIDGHEERIAWLEVVRFALTRRKVFITFVAALCVGLACAYLTVAPPRFVARAELVLDPRGNQDPVLQAVPNAELELAFIESQIEILKSEAILKEVAANTGYAVQPGLASRALQAAKPWIETLPPIPDELQDFLTWAGGLVKSANPDRPAVSSQDVALQKKIEAMDEQLNVRRLGFSNVVSIQFADTDPAMAAAVTNSVIDVYNTRLQQLQKNLFSEYKTWLEERVGQLGGSAAAQEEVIARFKQNNDILALGLESAAEKQIGEISIQLTLARAQTAEAQARLGRLSDAQGSLEDKVTGDLLKNEVVTRLRLLLFDVKKRLEQAETRYGTHNPAAVDLSGEKAALERALSDELRRVEGSYRSEYEIAAAREKSLANSLQSAARQAADGASKRAALKEMEALAQNFRVMSESFARRLAETAPRFQTTPEARVITRASPPHQKSEPRFALTLAGALAAGVLLGGCVAAAREYRRDVFRDLRKVRRWTDAECLVSLPRIHARDLRVKAGDRKRAGPPESRLDRAARFAVARPSSRFARQIRHLALQLSPASKLRTPMVIGVVSAEGGEGKTVVAANLAHVSAAIGRRTLLMGLAPPSDAAAVPEKKTSKSSRRSSQKSEARAMKVDPESGLEFAPPVPATAFSQIGCAVLSDQLQEVIEERYQTYDLIIVDLPAVNDRSDVAALAGLIDQFVLVVESYKTTGSNVDAAFAAVPRLRDNLLAVVLNKNDDSSIHA